MTDPLVSVVIAAYNADQFVASTIESALAQTYRNLEVCAVDDGSTDKTASVIESFARHDERVRVQRQPNKGQAAAKNAGIAMARGSLIAFLDADDMWVAHKLERQVTALAPPNVGVCYTDAMFINERGVLFSRPRPVYYSGQITRRLFLDNFIHFPSTLVKRECFAHCGVFDESLPMGIDWDLWLRISTQYDFVCVPEALLRYRIWPGQMSTKLDGRFDCAYRIMRKFQSQHERLIDSRLRRRAWSSTFLSHARRLAAVGRHRDAARRLGMAFVQTPVLAQVWIEAARLGIGALALSRKLP